MVMGWPPPQCHVVFVAVHMTDQATLSLYMRWYKEAGSPQRTTCNSWTNSVSSQLTGPEGERWWEERGLLVVYKEEGECVRDFGERIFS